MSDTRETCIAPECERPTWGHGDHCSSHTKQLQRTGRTKKIAEKVSLEERVINAANALAEADGDDDYDSALRAVLTASKSLGRKATGDAISAALAAAKARGVRVGRPPKVETITLRDVFLATLSVSLTARLLGVRKSTIWERVQKLRVSERPVHASADDANQ